MPEKQPLAIIQDDRRCSNYSFGHQIVAFFSGGNIDDNGMPSRWHYVEPRPIGQTRNCFVWWQEMIFHPPNFIYPNQDDACVNPKRFKPKSVESTA